MLAVARAVVETVTVILDAIITMAITAHAGFIYRCRFSTAMRQFSANFPVQIEMPLHLAREIEKRYEGMEK